MINKNKRGASLSGWTEAGIGVLILVACMGFIVIGMNSMYSKNYDYTFGFSSNDTINEFQGYQSNLQSGMEGEASTNAISGVSVVSSWGILKAGLSMTWNLVSGQWIMNSIKLLQLGQAGDTLAWGLRLLYIFSIGFILIKILFKVKA